MSSQPASEPIALYVVQRQSAPSAPWQAIAGLLDEHAARELFQGTLEQYRASPVLYGTFQLRLLRVPVAAEVVENVGVQP